MATLLLSHAEVSSLLNAPSLLESIRQALRLGPGAALEKEVPVKTERVAAPGGSDERTLIHVYDASLPAPSRMAVIDAARVLSLQRALIHAAAADALAAPKASRVALIGATSRTSLHLKSLRLVRSLNATFIYDPRPERAAVLAQRLFETLALPTRVAHSIEEAVASADIVVVEDLAEAVLFPGMVLEGGHIQALGSDVIFAQTLRQQSESFHDAAEASSGQVGTPLGAVLRGEYPVPKGSVTLFASTDPQWMDATSAWDLYQAASVDDSLTRFDFEAGR